jgi:hypothetical protein
MKPMSSGWSETVTSCSVAVPQAWARRALAGNGIEGLVLHLLTHAVADENTDALGHRLRPSWLPLRLLDLNADRRVDVLRR